MTKDEETESGRASPPRSVFDMAERGAGLHIHPSGERAEIYRMEQARHGKARAAFVRTATLNLASGEIEPVGARRLSAGERRQIEDWAVRRLAEGEDPAARARRLLAKAADAIREAPELGGAEAQSLLMALHFARLQVVDRMLAPRNASLASAAESSLAALMEAARSHEAWGRFEDAETLIRNALEKWPGSVDLLWMHTGVLMNLGRMKEARSANAKALAQKPGASEFLRREGYLAWLAEDWAALARAFGEIWDQQMSGFECRILGRARIELGELDAADEALRRAVDVAPEDAQTHALISDLACLRENWTEARAAGERSVALDPGNLGAWLYLGRARIELGEAAEARAALQAAGALSPVENRPRKLAEWFGALEGRLAALEDAAARA